MSKLDYILQSISANTENPSATIRREMERTGKKAVGCMLEFCPEELIYAAGMLPVGLWSGDVDPALARQYFPAFFCAPIQSSLELALRGAFDGVLSAVVVPILCDALKSAGQNWRISVPQIPMIPIVYPQNRKLEAGRNFLRSELLDVRKRLEEVCSHSIEDEAITKAIDLYNRYRLTMQEFSAVAPHHADVITPSIRHSVFQASFFQDKKGYMELVKELVEELKKLPEVTGERRVALTGIALDAPGVLRVMDQQGLTVVLDTLAQESGQVDTLVPDGEDPFARMAAWWAEMRCSSLAMDDQKDRVTQMVTLAKEGKTDGVIITAPAFCDPEEYDYPIFHSALEEAGVHHIYLEMTDHGAAEQTASRLQAFSELLN